jgi:NAD(P)-dependent dehydrogenase (short-subunit alcohol dehydrogenase family)
MDKVVIVTGASGGPQRALAYRMSILPFSRLTDRSISADALIEVTEKRGVTHARRCVERRAPRHNSFLISLSKPRTR